MQPGNNTLQIHIFCRTSFSSTALLGRVFLQDYLGHKWCNVLAYSNLCKNIDLPSVLNMINIYHHCRTSGLIMVLEVCKSNYDSGCLQILSFPDMTSISRQPQVFSRQVPKMWRHMCSMLEFGNWSCKKTCHPLVMCWSNSFPPA